MQMPKIILINIWRTVKEFLGIYKSGCFHRDNLQHELPTTTILTL